MAADSGGGSCGSGGVIGPKPAAGTYRFNIIVADTGGLSTTMSLMLTLY